MSNNKRVTWYECDCDWTTDHCEENHQRSMTIGEIKAEALEEAAVAAITSMELIQNGCATVAPKSHAAGERLVAWLRARAAEYRSGART